MDKYSSKEVEYFKARIKKAETFCARFPNNIDFVGKSVLDIGCGHGALSIHASQKGAEKVIGIDLAPKLIMFANEIVKSDYLKISHRIQFLHSSIENLDQQTFDIIMSQATMEHVNDPTSCLENVRRRLKKNGLFYLGFGPLYNAPFGDHRLLKIPFQKYFPWAHCMTTREQIIEQYNIRNPGQRIQHLSELGLNGLSFKEYQNIFRNCGLKIMFYKVNCHSHALVKLINALHKLPFLKEYLTFNVYIIFQKT